MGKLIFNEENHQYFLDDKEIPSVTKILRAEGFIDGTWFDEYSRQRGSMIHIACHLDDTGELDESTVDPVIAPYLSAYRLFKSDSGFIASQSEVPQASVIYGYAGTPDKLGTFKDASCAIIDIKSGAIMPWVALQLALYQVLCESRYKRFAVQLKPDGKYSIKEFKDRTDRAIALGAVAQFHWKRNHGI